MEIPKMKILIYALTFLGYAWSGYGAGMLGNLRDAILAAEQVFGDVLENVITVARRFRDVHEVLDAAVEENCKYTCPLGGNPVKNKYHKPSSNGCGTEAVKVEITDYLPNADMTQCCNEHDICYDTCNSVKENCDFEFQRCLFKICEKVKGPETILKACKAAAKMMFTSTMTLGCKAYLDSQKKACYCAPDNRKKKFTPGGEL